MRLAISMVLFFPSVCFAADPSSEPVKRTDKQVEAANTFVFEGIGWQTDDTAKLETFRKMYPSDANDKIIAQVGANERFFLFGKMTQGSKVQWTNVVEYSNGRLLSMDIRDLRPNSYESTYKHLAESLGEPDSNVNVPKSGIRAAYTRTAWKLDTKHVLLKASTGSVGGGCSLKIVNVPPGTTKWMAGP